MILTNERLNQQPKYEILKKIFTVKEEDWEFFMWVNNEPKKMIEIKIQKIQDRSIFKEFKICSVGKQESFMYCFEKVILEADTILEFTFESILGNLAAA